MFVYQQITVLIRQLYWSPVLDKHRNSSVSSGIIFLWGVLMKQSNVNAIQWSLCLCHSYSSETRQDPVNEYKPLKPKEKKKKKALTATLFISRHLISTALKTMGIKSNGTWFMFWEWSLCMLQANPEKHVLSYQASFSRLACPLCRNPHSTDPYATCCY